MYWWLYPDGSSAADPFQYLMQKACFVEKNLQLTLINPNFAKDQTLSATRPVGNFSEPVLGHDLSVSTKGAKKCKDKKQRPERFTIN
jgi:hypothetical protein